MARKKVLSDFCGAICQIRTDDIHFTKVALYHWAKGALDFCSPQKARGHFLQSILIIPKRTRLIL